MDVTSAQYNYVVLLTQWEGSCDTLHWPTMVGCDSRFWTPISRFLLLVILNSPDFYLAKVDRSAIKHSNTMTP